VKYHLICAHPFGKYAKGQKITDPDEVSKLMDDRDHQFVRVNAPVEPLAPGKT
jgi:hypothetical protein